MYSLNIKKTESKEAEEAKRQEVLNQRLRMKRERLGSRSRQRCSEWLRQVENSDCKTLCDGAVRSSLSPEKSQFPRNSTLKSKGLIFDEDLEAGPLQPFEGTAPLFKREATKTILSPDKSHFNKVYVRNYEPEYVRRAKSRGGYLKSHLELEAYKGNATQIFKSLLRKRDLSSERTHSKTIVLGQKRISRENENMIDSTAKDMSLYYHPDFRSPATE
jgi:hypothetical protein